MPSQDWTGYENTRSRIPEDSELSKTTVSPRIGDASLKITTVRGLGNW